MRSSPAFNVDLEAVILAVTNNVLRVLIVDPKGRPALPSGPLHAEDRTIDRGLRRWVCEQTELEVGYVEQLYTFGDQYRDPSERSGGPRLLSIAYLALIHEEQPSQGATWQNCYDFLPWEDHRVDRPAVLDDLIRPALEMWTRAGGPEERTAREERAQITFALRDAPWDPVRALERYELLYEVGLVPEASRDRGQPVPSRVLPAASMTADHRRVLATALSRIRGKLTYRPVVFELLPETFTLGQLQAVVETLTGMRLHTQNFRRLVDRAGLVEGTGRQTGTGGRPAELFRFRREVIRERPRPGVGLPGMSH